MEVTDNETLPPSAPSLSLSSFYRTQPRRSCSPSAFYQVERSYRKTTIKGFTTPRHSVEVTIVINSNMLKLKVILWLAASATRRTAPLARTLARVSEDESEAKARDNADTRP